MDIQKFLEGLQNGNQWMKDNLSLEAKLAFVADEAGVTVQNNSETGQWSIITSENKVYYGDDLESALDAAMDAINIQIDQFVIKRAAEREEVEFPVYYDSQGREHQEF